MALGAIVDSKSYQWESRPDFNIKKISVGLPTTNVHSNLTRQHCPLMNLAMLSVMAPG
jgi:hypothetical protein